MAYCTINDLYSSETEAKVAMLSNAEQPTKLDETFVNTIIEKKSKVIDGYVRGRYPLEDVISDPILNSICVELTIYDLHYKSNKGKIPELLKLSKEEQERKLRDIQRGILTLDIPDDNERPVFVDSESPARRFTDELYEEYDNV